MKIKNPYPTADAHLGEVGNTIVLLCPTCGNDYTHQGEPQAALGYDHEQPDIETRGDGIRIPFACENGHAFNLILAQHKGNTWVYCETNVPASEIDIGLSHWVTRE